MALRYFSYPLTNHRYVRIKVFQTFALVMYNDFLYNSITQTDTLYD